MSDLLSTQPLTLPHLLSFFPVSILPRLREVCKAFNNIILWHLGNLEKVTISPATSISVLNSIVPLCPKLTLLNLSGCKLEQLGALAPYALANIQSLCMISCKFGHGDIFNLLLQTRVTNIHICFSDISFCRPLLRFATKSGTIKEINTCFCYDEDAAIVANLIDISQKRAKPPENYKLDIIQRVSEGAPNYQTSIYPLLFSWLDMGVNFLQLSCITYILSLLPDSESDWESLQKLTNRVPEFTRILFMYALQARRVNTVTFLLQKGVKVPSDEGYELLLRNLLTTNYNVVLLDTLLSNPEHVHKLFTFDGQYQGTVLHMFLRFVNSGTELVNLTTKFLRIGYKLDTRDSNNQTVLHIACQRHLVNVINAILTSTQKFDINARDSANRTPLRLALSPDSLGDAENYTDMQRASCIKLISGGANINAVDSNNKSILDFVLQANFVDVLLVLISLNVHITPAVLSDHSSTLLTRPAIGVIIVKYLFERYHPSTMQSDLAGLLRKSLEKFSVLPADLPAFTDLLGLIFAQIDLNGTAFSPYNFFRSLVSKCVIPNPPFDRFFADLLRRLLFVYSQKCGDTNLPYSLIPFAEMEKQDTVCFQRTEEILRTFLTVAPPSPHHLPNPYTHNHHIHAHAHHSHSPLSHLHHTTLPDAKQHAHSPLSHHAPSISKHSHPHSPRAQHATSPNPKSHSPIPSYPTSNPISITPSYPRAISPPTYHRAVSPPTPMSTSPTAPSAPFGMFGGPSQSHAIGPNFIPRAAAPMNYMPRVNSPTFPQQSRTTTSSPIPISNYPLTGDFHPSFYRQSFASTPPPPSESLNLNPIYNLQGDEISRNFQYVNPIPVAPRRAHTPINNSAFNTFTHLKENPPNTNTTAAFPPSNPPPSVQSASSLPLPYSTPSLLHGPAQHHPALPFSPYLPPAPFAPARSLFAPPQSLSSHSQDENDNHTATWRNENQEQTMETDSIDPNIT